MAVIEFDCAADLLGRAVVVSRRVPGIWCEIEGRCVAVISSVPGDFCSGVIEVEGPAFNPGGLSRYPIDLSEWAVDGLSAAE
jgi:hypothetical protein